MAQNKPHPSNTSTLSPKTEPGPIRSVCTKHAPTGDIKVHKYLNGKVDQDNHPTNKGSTPMHTSMHQKALFVNNNILQNTYCSVSSSGTIKKAHPKQQIQKQATTKENTKTASTRKSHHRKHQISPQHIQSNNQVLYNKENKKQ